MGPESGPWRNIEHIVVLMLENRSFDSLLGWLYDPGNEPPYNQAPKNFEGLSGKSLSNPDQNGNPVPVRKADVRDVVGPLPNPGEPYEDVYSQVYDQPRCALVNVPPNPTGPPTMKGFIRNYSEQSKPPANPRIIMECHTPAAVPVLSALAHNYAACDHWFASIPTQTFCNRSFVHAGTSSGYVNNAGGGHCFVNDTPTIFDVLEAAGKSWTIFCGSWLLECFALLTQKRLWKYALTDRFAHFGKFISAASRKGGLPNYSFIEPIYFDSIVWGAENDMHPECNFYEFYGPSNLHKGDALIWKVYEAIRNGPNWESTCLIVLFDEHGGCYDHVPPPTSADCPVAVSPDGIVIPKTARGGSGFDFDRLGPRVPAIIVSAYTKAGTILNDVFEHTSVLSTIVNCFSLPRNQLGARQARAKDVSAALNSPAARTDKPEIQKPTSSVFEELKEEAHFIAHLRLVNAQKKPMSDLQRVALHGVANFAGDESLHARIEGLQTELEGGTVVAEHEAKMVKEKIARIAGISGANSTGRE
ncbi:MAG TPA: alkaline phosphatase family protein [Candidatus Acidoferrales bacterium]|nr:alkaline phosphatase family protein [Candidatus Acidoferrales bacterium]